MREAFNTVLHNSDHLYQGASLIEGLVGMALQTMVQDHARHALKHNVFQTPEDLRAALEQMRAKNTGGHSLASQLRGEHAMAMDTLQYLCEPETPGSEPQVRRDRAAYIYETYYLNSGDTDDAAAAEQWIDSLSVESIQSAIDSIDSFYQDVTDLWQIGYPDTRAGDVEGLSHEYISRDPPLKAFLPSLHRAYQLEARMEAGRRSTELSYEIHLFKAQYGRPPTSLDELPIDPNRDIAIDPFTGGNFSYRLTDDGFTLYSSFENGIDDGGVHSPHGDTEESGSDDFVFWPPR
jgi:hypothetical protein